MYGVRLPQKAEMWDSLGSVLVFCSVSVSVQVQVQFVG